MHVLRFRGRLAVGFAVIAVATAVVIVVVAAGGSAPPGSDPERLRGPVAAVPDPGEWRTEYWRDVRVDVPADWAWGVTPRGAAGSLSYCGGVFDGPYVGRPIAQSDACVSFELEPPPPTHPYLWLDADLPPGAVDLGGGWVRETVEVGESTVTVASEDAGLRERILSSIEPADLCPAKLAAPPAPRRDWTFEGIGRMVSAEVCAYRRGGGGFRLTYAAELTAEAVERTYAAADEAPDGPVCKATNEFVVVSAVYEDPYSATRQLRLHHDLVFDMDCGHIAVESVLERRSRYAVINRASVEPWADGGTRAIVCWGGASWAHRHLLQGWC